MLALTPSPTRNPSSFLPLDTFSSEQPITRRALLTSEDLALVAPTARGALNFVGAEFFGADQTRREKAIKKEGAIATVGRYCINPEVRTAVVNVINAAVDSNHPKELVQETLSTILKMPLISTI